MKLPSLSSFALAILLAASSGGAAAQGFGSVSSGKRLPDTVATAQPAEARPVPEVPAVAPDSPPAPEVSAVAPEANVRARCGRAGEPGYVRLRCGRRRSRDRGPRYHGRPSAARMPMPSPRARGSRVGRPGARQEIGAPALPAALRPRHRRIPHQARAQPQGPKAARGRFPHARGPVLNRWPQRAQRLSSCRSRVSYPNEADL